MRIAIITDTHIGLDAFKAFHKDELRVDTGDLSLNRHPLSVTKPITTGDLKVAKD